MLLFLIFVILFYFLLRSVLGDFFSIIFSLLKFGSEYKNPLEKEEKIKKDNIEDRL